MDLLRHQNYENKNTLTKYLKNSKGKEQPFRIIEKI